MRFSTSTSTNTMLVTSKFLKGSGVDPRSNSNRTYSDPNRRFRTVRGRGHELECKLNRFRLGVRQNGAEPTPTRISATLPRSLGVGVGVSCSRFAECRSCTLSCCIRTPDSMKTTLIRPQKNLSAEISRSGQDFVRFGSGFGD